MESGLMDADMPLEEVWADLEEMLGDRMPEQIFAEDQSWFSMAQYKNRYKQSDRTIRHQLAQWVDDGVLETQLQKRHRHNVRCYRAAKARAST